GALVEPPAIEEAAVAGLLVIENHRVRAAHPLLAAAARNRATPGEQRQLHLALAERAGDETLRARHLALAARTHDRELAATLTEAAARAIARGAAHDAVELAERALALTPPDASEHSERLLELGRYLIVAGELPSARELLEPKVEELPAGRIRGRAYLLLGECNDGA